MAIEDQLKELNFNIKKLIDVLSNFKLPENDSINRLIPLPRWNEYHQYPSIPALRNMVFNEKFNGASIWIKRVGKRILIDEKVFFEWVRNNE